MATNPNNSIGTNAAYGGRTSPKAFNDVLAAFKSRGVLSGWTVSPNTGMTVVLGGNGTDRDVAIAEDNIGNMTTVNNISGNPIALTIAAAPASQSRIDAIVVYVNNPPQGTSTATDNYGAVGILDVEGATSATPVAPNESAIRTAITADGASGATAYYVVLAYVTVASGTTTITGNLIQQGAKVELDDGLAAIPDGSITGSKIASSTITSSNIDWSTISIENYSSTEKAIGTWDGVTLYRRTFTVNRTEAGEITIWTYASGSISPKKLEAYLASSTRPSVLQPIGQFTGSGATSRSLCDDTTFKIQASADWPTATYDKVIGIVEYTKN